MPVPELVVRTTEDTPLHDRPTVCGSNSDNDSQLTDKVETLTLEDPPISGECSFGDGSDKIFGFENFGNTCYFNSILQCLYYTKAFRLEILKYPVRDKTSKRQRKLIMNGSRPHPSKLAQTTNPTAPTTNESDIGASRNDKAKVSLARRTSNFFGMGKKSDEDLNDNNMNVVMISLPNIRPSANSQVLVGKVSDPALNTIEARKKAAIMTGPVINVDHSLNDYGLEDSLYTSLKDIFESMVESESLRGVVSPSYLIETLKRENELFRSAQHQDAHEFLNFLLNSVLDTLNSYLNVKENAIHDLFQGILTNLTKCLTCESVTTRDEPFLDLSVDLNGSDSLESSLSQFSESEMLSGPNKFYCDNCHSLQEAEKRMGVKRFPKILALHMKRFKFSEEHFRMVKLFDKITYPLFLKFNCDINPSTETFYALYAVVVHIGGGPNFGHYVTLIKSIQNGWLLFDDETVEKVDEEFVLRFVGGDGELATAYVLFYQQISKEAYEKAHADGEKDTTNESPTITEQPKSSFDSGLNSRFTVNHGASNNARDPKRDSIASLENLTEHKSHDFSMRSSTEHSTSSNEKDKERKSNFKSFKSKFRSSKQHPTNTKSSSPENSVSEPSANQTRSSSSSSKEDSKEPSTDPTPLTPPPPTYSSSLSRRESTKGTSTNNNNNNSKQGTSLFKTNSGKGDEPKEKEKEKKRKRMSMSFGFKRS